MDDIEDTYQPGGNITESTKRFHSHGLGEASARGEVGSRYIEAKEVDMRPEGAGEPMGHFDEPAAGEIRVCSVIIDMFRICLECKERLWNS